MDVQAVYYGLRTYLLAMREAAHKAMSERNKALHSQQAIQQQQQQASSQASGIARTSSEVGPSESAGQANSVSTPQMSNGVSPKLTSSGTLFQVSSP